MKNMLGIAILLLIQGATWIGCDHTHKSANDDHGHAHEESLQLTAYSNEFELFAEATPFVRGQESDILAHFSHLENFKPLTTGSVTASLTVGAATVVETLDEPVRAGIYLFTLQPGEAGVGSITFDIKTSAGFSRMIVPVTVYTNDHDAHHSAANAAVESSEGVVFTKEQSWKVDFATTPARSEPFGQIIRTTAQIQPSQGNEWTVTAKAGGVVLFSNNNIVEGKAVNAGQTLFTIEGGGMADNNLSVRNAEAESGYHRAKAEYERKSELAKDKIVSQSDLLQAKTEFINAEAVYNNLRKNFSTGRQVVSSPIGGFITRVLVRNGEYADMGQPVLLVSQNRDLLIKAEVQPRYFEILNRISTAHIRPLNGERTYTLEELNGRLVSYGKTTDITAPLIPVIFQINNKAGMLPGSFVELFIITRTSTRAVTVPATAIIEELGNYFVFVQLTPEYFEKRAIKKGGTDGLRIEILNGVSEGERVVSKGAMLVKLAQASGALDAHSGHVH